MQEPIEDRNLTAILPLTPPRQLKAKLPITASAAETVRNGRAAIRNALHGRDDRLVVGPEPTQPWQNVRLLALLNHTTLLEPLFFGAAPNRLLWELARRGLVPG